MSKYGMGWSSQMVVENGKDMYNMAFRPCGLRQMSVCVWNAYKQYIQTGEGKNVHTIQSGVLMTSDCSKHCHGVSVPLNIYRFRPAECKVCSLLIQYSLHSL